MAIAVYADLLPAMNVRLPDCPPDRIEQALWLAGRDFCVETEAYVAQLAAIDGVEDQKNYTLTIPSPYDAHRITEVRRRTEDEVTDGEKGTIIDATNYNFHYESNLLEFFVAPFQEDITDGLTVELALVPEEDLGSVPLDAGWFRRWAEYSKAGAFYRLFSDDKLPWFSPQQAAIELATYRKGIAYARREVRIEGTNRQLRLNINNGVGGSWA
jgi:hypothetical protein